MSGLSRSLLLSAAVAANAGAQKLLLELRPHAGDTLRMQLQQVTEMSGRGFTAAGTTVTTTLIMYSRAIVESAAPIASLISAVTDSVAVSSTDPRTATLARQAEGDIKGRRMRLRLWPDGTVTLNDGASSVPREVSELVAVMPASFPTKPVAVGGSWLREMPVPAGEAVGIPPGSVVRARFHLDSVSADGELAWVSMFGTLVPATKAAAKTVGGSVRGNLVVNRKRGWLSASHFLLVLQSMPGNGPVDDSKQFSVRVTQSMNVLLPAHARRR